MTKAIFTSRPMSIYDDLVEVRYHFPKIYLRRVQTAVNDWIVYYEPSRLSPDRRVSGGRQSYFATAKVVRVEADNNRKDHFYAYVSDYLPFDRIVPFKEGAYYYEKKLQKDDGSTNKGAFGSSVRLIGDDEFDAILAAGFARVFTGEDAYYNVNPEKETGDTGSLQFELGEESKPFDLGETEEERDIVEQLTKRPFRDEAFRYCVREAYGNACAITGLKILNGGGRPEVQAAHIKAVEHKGPDSIRNGLALSGTAHWMFDRGLISVSNDYKILTADKYIPPEVRGLLNDTGEINLPNRPELHPHPKFLEFHRDKIFKGVG